MVSSDHSTVECFFNAGQSICPRACATELPSLSRLFQSSLTFRLKSVRLQEELERSSRVEAEAKAEALEMEMAGLHRTMEAREERFAAEKKTALEAAGARATAWMRELKQARDFERAAMAAQVAAAEAEAQAARSTSVLAQKVSTAVTIQCYILMRCRLQIADTPSGPSFANNSTVHHDAGTRPATPPASPTSTHPSPAAAVTGRSHGRRPRAEADSSGDG